LENNEKIPVPAFTDTDNDSISFVTVEVWVFCLHFILHNKYSFICFD
jgi:hypothetical protein